MKKKSKKKSLVIMYIVLGVGIAGILTFGIWLGVDHYLDWQSRNFYTVIAEGIEVRPRSPGNIAAAQSPTENGDGSSVAQNLDKDDWVAFADFEELSGRFPGIVGWIRLEGTAINYPIMQWTDNDFFLSHLPDGTSHRSGSIFLDFRNTPDFSDRNSILYGHMSRTDDMFGVLKYFREQAFYDANSIMYIHTPERDYQLAIFAVHLVNSSIEQPTTYFRDDEHFAEYLRKTKSRSMISSDVEVSIEDRIVTLATCAYDFDNARLVVIGKLIAF